MKQAEPLIPITEALSLIHAHTLRIHHEEDWSADSTPNPRVFNGTELVLIKALKELYGDYYSYETSNFEQALIQDKIYVTCPKHGELLLNATELFNGQGCEVCNITASEEEIDEVTIYTASSMSDKLNDATRYLNAVLEEGREVLPDHEVGDIVSLLSPIPSVHHIAYIPTRSLYIIFAETLSVAGPIAQFIKEREAAGEHVLIADQCRPYTQWLSTTEDRKMFSAVIAKYPKQKVYVTAKDVQQSVRTLYNMVTNSCKHDRFIVYGVHRGGTMFSVPLAQTLALTYPTSSGLVKYQRYDAIPIDSHGSTMTPVPEVQFLEEAADITSDHFSTAILVVDDLISSGETLKATMEAVSKHYGGKLAVYGLVAYGKTDLPNRIFAANPHPGKWICFPYEQV